MLQKHPARMSAGVGADGVVWQCYFSDPEICVCIITKTYHSGRKFLGWAYRGLTGGFLLLQNFSAAISVSPHVCFILVLILISVSKIMHL